MFYKIPGTCTDILWLYNMRCNIAQDSFIETVDNNDYLIKLPTNIISVKTKHSQTKQKTFTQRFKIYTNNHSKSNLAFLTFW